MAAEDWIDLWMEPDWPWEDYKQPLHEWIAKQEDKLAKDIKIAENRLLRKLRYGTITHPVKRGNVDKL